MCKLLVVFSVIISITNSQQAPTTNKPPSRYPDIASAQTFEELAAIAADEAANHDKELVALQNKLIKGINNWMEDVQERGDRLKAKMADNDASCQKYSEVDEVVAESNRIFTAELNHDHVTNLKEFPALQDVYKQFTANIDEIQDSIETCRTQRCSRLRYRRRLLEAKQGMEEARDKFKPASLRAFGKQKAYPIAHYNKYRNGIRSIEAEWKTCVDNLQ